MKKLIFTVLAITLAFTLGTTALAGSACAWGGCHGGGRHRESRVCRFTDADGDGVCDNCARAEGVCRFTDADGDGVCDNGPRDRSAGFCGGGGRRPVVKKS